MASDAENEQDGMLLDTLRQYADLQGGYFLSKQADEAGVSRQLLSYYAREDGPVYRYYRGLYRIKDYPKTRFDRIIAEWYDTGRRIKAAISHESAADVHGLTKRVTHVVHMTAPMKYGERRPPKGVVLYFDDDGVPAAEQIEFHGVPVTSIERTVVDLLESRGANNKVSKIIDEALTTRKTSVKALQQTARERSKDHFALLEEARKAS